MTCEPCKCNLITKNLDAKEILFMSCYFFDVERAKITGKSRKRELVEKRQMIMTIISENTKTSLVKIGRMFCRDHTTVIHSKYTVRDLCDTDESFRARYQELKKFIFNN